MPVLWLILIIIAITTVGFLLGCSRAQRSVNGNVRALHSLPSYYGINVGIWTAIPAFVILGLWLLIQPVLIESHIQQSVQSIATGKDVTFGLIMSDIRRVADGLELAITEGGMTLDEIQSNDLDIDTLLQTLNSLGVILGTNVSNSVLKSAQEYQKLSAGGNILMSITVLATMITGLGLALVKTNKNFRARISVEYGILAILFFAASIAIMTTIGILFSLAVNTLEFFKLYSAIDFFFGLEWAPSFSGRGGSSSLGVIPLLWGTLYISVIALLVAVPIGIYAAIYLSEYATPKVRAFTKPLLEILAGIPTIVYGLFALLTVGPMLVKVFGNNTVGWMDGGTAVITAGFVMGIMLIPFVSSLSDDIINAVPQTLRDGSYGLGATQSETIQQIVLPAALPGIVGAILLAASRAVGETMIVVLGAGAAARLSLNPFEAMTAVTAKIVSQLTGDSDFASPEVLVAFALGTTLFFLTLGLNVLALYVVRKYREQYE
ncbi:MAG: phosphate ABC transporter permease subunit PstC [Aestuariivita sp.]|nr:phosphate ABC transporter permease subunit PstC [Aestuariivita sp.]